MPSTRMEKLKEQWRSESYDYPSEFNTLEDLASLLDQVLLGQSIGVHHQEGIRNRYANLTSGSPSTPETDSECDEEMEMAIREHKRAFARLNSFRQVQEVAPSIPGVTQSRSCSMGFARTSATNDIREEGGYVEGESVPGAIAGEEGCVGDGAERERDDEAAISDSAGGETITRGSSIIGVE
uniref:Uncharacterized protein n=1 Tax=Cannabis sativa TaxID=3483 RepID=A0A803PJF6_CANSA